MDGINQAIEDYLAAHGGRYPRNDKFARDFGITTVEAEEFLSRHRGEYGKRVRNRALVESVGTAQKEEKTDGKRPGRNGLLGDKDPGSRKSSLLDRALDGGALGVAIVIDLLLNAVVFWVIAPDLITKLGMVSLSFIVVLFSLRGWVKGGVIGRTLWVVFALVATFSDISFALSATDLQAKQTDRELVRLTDKVDHDQRVVDELVKQYGEVGTGFRSELTVRQSAIDGARKALSLSLEARGTYLAETAKSGPKGQELTSDKVFSAIWDSIESGRWIQLIFFTLIFLGLQLTIVSAATISLDRAGSTV